VTGEPILRAEELVFSYPDGTRALNGISLSVPRGKKTAFLGPNGAGKTTLFLHFNGLLRPQSGCVYWSGRRVRYDRSSLMTLRQNVGVVFQDPDTQLFSANVRQEISFGPCNLGWPAAKVQEQVDRAMAAVDILHLQDKPTHFLSLGQKKRVAIAAVLAMQPRVLVCDEPTAWLDAAHAAAMMDLLDRQTRDGVTVIFSTHDVDLAYSRADYVFVMKDGKLAGEGHPADIFLNDGLLARADLAQPQLVEIYRDLVEKGWLPPGRPPRTKQELLERIPPRGGRRCSK